jgi:Arm DNA-binding domain
MTPDKRMAITDRALKSLEKHPPSERTEIMDASRPAFGVRINPRGKARFFVVARFGDGKHPTRRVIGEYGPATDAGLNIYTLADAAAVAERWRKTASTGFDPNDERKRAGEARRQQRANTFEIVAEEFLTLHVIGPDPGKPRQRRAVDVANSFCRIFIAAWGGRPITAITRADVLDLIEAIRDRGTVAALAALRNGNDATKTAAAPIQARNLLSYLKTFFSWAIERGAYGWTVRPVTILGRRESSARKNRPNAF